MSGSDDNKVAGSRAPRGGPWSWRRRQGVRPRPSRRMTIIGWVSVVLVSALVLATLGAYVKYREVWDSIHRVDVTNLGNRPPTYASAKYTNALNLLVFASGSTAGLTRSQQLAWHVGSNSGDAVSETIMIVHISPGRHLVTVVNIPRDTVVPLYACARGPGWPGQQANPGAIEQIDQTLSYGGPSCLWNTVERDW
jgi:anionic cell wall polymer biosynthesis LytR-Cps2A-Psr (LCP) family protein